MNHNNHFSFKMMSEKFIDILSNKKYLNDNMISTRVNTNLQICRQ